MSICELEEMRRDIDNRLNYMLSIDGDSEMIKNLEEELHLIDDQMRKGA